MKSACVVVLGCVMALAASLLRAQVLESAAGLSQKVAQANIETPTPVQEFFGLLQTNHDFSAEHVFSYDEQAAQTAMEGLNALSERFRESQSQKIVASKAIGDFSLTLIKLSDEDGPCEKLAHLLMFREEDAWKFISGANFKADLCRQQFDRRQLGAFFSLLMWAEDYGV